MSSKKKTNIQDPIDIITKVKFSSSIDYSKYIEKIKCDDLTYCIGPYFNALIDLNERKFVYISPSVEYILGYNSSMFLNNKLDVAFSKYHPDTLATQQALYREINRFFDKLSIRVRSKYIISFDISLKNKNGNYQHFIQYNRCLRYNFDGSPRLLYILCLDITDYRESFDQILIISKITAKGIKQVYKNVFYSEYEKGILTRKEVEIWNLIQKGLSSKEIAQHLAISVHTVNTHRKKIYKKLRQFELMNKNS